MKNFVDFVVDASKQGGLADEFQGMVQSSDSKTMSKWLKGKGYAVNESECKKMVENKDDIKTSRLGWAY